MEKVIGVPSGFFNRYHNFWKYYFEKLGLKVVFSKPTDNEIFELGMKYSNDEMCMSLKNFLGHVAYLQDKCNYILIPRINNYGINEQMCTNFSAIYDIVNNLFEKEILNFDIDYEKGKTEQKGLFEVGRSLGFSKKECKKAYEYARIKDMKQKKQKYIREDNKLNNSSKKILLLGHDYACHDNMIGKPIVDYLKKENCEVLYADSFPSDITRKLSSNICHHLYWKQNREIVGTLELCKDKIDGIILLSTFPCGPDSLVNELLLRRVSKPILNLVIDDVNSFTGIETRLESFLDIIPIS